MLDRNTEQDRLIRKWLAGNTSDKTIREACNIKEDPNEV